MIKKVLFIYPPFATPVSPPHSIAYFKSIFKNHLPEIKFKAFDLNIEFHKLKFENPFKTIESDYEKISQEFQKETSKVYMDQNHAMIKGEKPEYFEKLLKIILDEKPDLVMFSCVYNSQVIYANTLSRELKKTGIKTALGGPAINEKYTHFYDYLVYSDHDFSKIFRKDIKFTLNEVPIYEKKNENYFSPENVYMIKFSQGCFWKKCTFCTHHQSLSYHRKKFEILEEEIKDKKYIFFIDDMISSPDAVSIGKITKKHNIKFAFQAKPNSFSEEQLKVLGDSGCTYIMWGVESGSQKILDLMQKGTKVDEIERVLRQAHESGIKNSLFILFGFPGSTEETEKDTIEFIKKNEKYIDLIHTSIFGLQEYSYVYEHYKDFGIESIRRKKRTNLPDEIMYEFDEESKKNNFFTQDNADKFRHKYLKLIKRVNKYPKMFNIYREHFLICASNHRKIK